MSNTIRGTLRDTAINERNINCIKITLSRLSCIFVETKLIDEFKSMNAALVPEEFALFS